MNIKEDTQLNLQLTSSTVLVYFVFFFCIKSFLGIDGELKILPLDPNSLHDYMIMALHTLQENFALSHKAKMTEEWMSYNLQNHVTPNL